MSRFLTLAGMALRELWISFRLLAIVGLLLLTALPATLLPHVVTPDLAGAPPDPLAWFAIVLGATLALVAAIAAATISLERRRGSAAWMAVRAVPRPTIMLAWFAAFSLLVVAGLLPAGLLVWFALGEQVLFTGPLPLAAAIGAAGCAGLAAVALGLLAGVLLPPLPAAIATVLPVGALLLATATGWDSWPSLPAGGLHVLATLDAAVRPVADAARSAGVALGSAAAVLVLAVAAFERADL